MRKNDESCFHNVLSCLRKGIWILLAVVLIVAAVYGGTLIAAGSRNQVEEAGASLIESLQAQDVGAAVEVVRGAQSVAEESEAAAASAETVGTGTGTAVESTASSDVSADASDSVDVIESFKAQYNELIDAGAVPELTSDEIITFQQQFSDTVFFGDSMAQAIGEYGIAASDRVIYQRGGTLPTILPLMANVQNIYPARIVIWTGLNDCTHYMTDYESYQNDLTAVINTAAQICGMENVYVCSLLPAADAIAAGRADLALAPTFNNYLQVTVASCGAHYIDTTWIVRQSLYLDDCIHMNSTFYDVWARYMMLAM